MKSLRRPSLFATLGALAVVMSCNKPTLSQHCTPFPPPSVTGASCSALPKTTRIQDLGNLEPGGGLSNTSIVVDDHAIYFTASDPGQQDVSLYRLPKAGGDPQVLDQGVTAPIVLDGPSLLYTRVTDNSEFSYPNVIQLGPQCLFEALPNAGGANTIQMGPTVDRAGVDWLATASAPQPMLVLRWDPGTDSTAVIDSIASSHVTSFAGDADHVYWTVPAAGPGLSNLTTITSEPSAGGARRTLASVPEIRAIVGVDDAALYLAGRILYAGQPTGGGGPVVRILKTDGSATTVVANACGATAYGVHDTNVYWAQGARVLRAPKTGGPAEVVLDLGDENTTLLGLAMDACNVYVNARTWGGGTSPMSYSIWGAAIPQGPATGAGDASALACDEEGDTDASTGDADEQ
jgi:hypothetical protein